MTKELHFAPVDLDRREEYQALLAATPQIASDYSFVNLYGWREVYGLEWAFDHGYAWIRQTVPYTVWWAPVGPWLDHDWSGCVECMRGNRFVRVPEKLAESWLPLAPQVSNARGMWDYVYRVTDLVDLPDPRYQKKRAKLEAFQASYAHDYHEMSPDCVEDVLEMQEDWCRWRDCGDSQALLAENEAIVRVLEDWDRLPGLMGGTIRTNGNGRGDRIVAYTVAEALTDDTVLIHFEKAHTEFEGAYQAINQYFLARSAPDFVYVNREQDLDEPGLRKAKLSYNPSGFLQKFEVAF
jgi:hypothetical protein